MINKLVAGTALAMILIAGAVSFGSTSASAADSCSLAANSVQLPKDDLRLEEDTWSGYLTVRDPAFKTAMEARHFKYTWTENDDQTVRACNMTGGKIDLMVTTAGQYLKHRPAGKIVGMIDESAGADALILDTKTYPYLKSMGQVQKLVRDFKTQGKKPVLAYAGDSPSEELLIELSNISEELKLSDFDLKPVADSPAAFKMVQDHGAQVAIVWEPDTTAARSAGYTVALSSKNVPRRILDVIVASDRIIKNNRPAVQAFVDEFYKARKWNIKHPSDYLAAIADDGKMKHDEAQSVLDGIHLYDATESDAFLNLRAYPYDEVPMWESLSAITSIDALKDPSLKASESMWDGSFAHQAVQDLK